MKRKTIVFLIILINLISYGADNYKIKEIDFKTFVDYYDISESKKHILSFQTQYEVDI